MRPWIAALFLAGAALGTSPSHAQMYHVRMAPPPMRAEARPPQPSPRHIWMEGYWGWNGGRHVWNPGRWEFGRPGYRFEQPRWVQEGGIWGFHSGRWIEETAPIEREVVVETQPPLADPEVVPVAPGPDFVWTQGYWGWREGRHVWIPGRYEHRREGQRWEPHRWVEDGGKWRFQPGGWRR